MNRIKLLWNVLFYPDKFILADSGMYLLKEIYGWTQYRNTPWAKNTEQVLKKYFGEK